MSSFRWGMIACPTQRNSQEAVWELRHLLFSSLSKPCFAYCLAHWRSPGVCILPSSFWSITLKCLDADQSTIPNMKGDILSFHMRHRSMICSKRLQRNSIRIPIEESYLVHKHFLLQKVYASRFRILYHSYYQEPDIHSLWYITPEVKWV